MSIIVQEDQLKGMPDEALASELENPSGGFPQYLVFAELNRRSDLRKRYSEQKAKSPANTMAEEMVAQVMGGARQAQPMQMMRDGGIVGYRNGGGVPSEEDIIRVMNERAVSREDAIRILKGSSLGVGATGRRPIGDLFSRIGGGIRDIFTPPDIPRAPSIKGLGSSARPEVGTETVMPEPDVPELGGFSDSPTPEVRQTDGTGKDAVTRGQSEIDVVPLFGPEKDDSKDYLSEYSRLVEGRTPTSNKDLASFRESLEKYMPEPSRTAAGGRALMSIGQGLLSQPTFAGGLAAGIPGVIESSLLYGREQNEYNKNRQAAETALFETQEARRVADQDRLFRGRTAVAEMGTRLRGDEMTAGARINALRAESIIQQIDAIDDYIANPVNQNEEYKAGLQRQRDSLSARLNELLGGPRERLRVE